MPNDWLELPHWQQSSEGRCLEACVCMVLSRLGHPVAEDTVAHLFDSTPVGTPSSRVKRLDLWGHQVEYRSASLAELTEWLANDVPVIAFVHTMFLDYWAENTPHAVVIVGLDDEHVYAHDPAFAQAPQTCRIDGFIVAWIEMDQVVAVIV
jgi:ABC-type bacteriocin/lantibiotic exporter with double-glycine peptidase domain